MSILQSTYTDTIAKGYPGMRPNGAAHNPISRTIETAAGIGFGKAAYRGANDHGILAAQTLVGAGSAKSGNVGTSTITTTPTVGAGAKIGRYTITQLDTSATGTLVVEDPDGIVVGRGVVGTAITTIPGITTFTVTSGGTATKGDQFFIDVTGNAFLGITMATSALGLIAGQTADTYAQYDNVEVETRGPVIVTLGGTVADGDPVGVDSNGDFVTGSGVPLPKGWVFDTTGVDDDLAIIVKR